MKGFRVRKPNGGISLIGPGYKNAGLRQKGTLNVVTPYPYGQAATSYYATLEVYAVNPFLALRCVGRYVSVVAAYPSGNGTWIYYILMPENVGTVEWWLFDNAEYAQYFTGNKGMRVRDPLNGAVLFDSRMKSLRVIANYSSAGDRNSSTAAPLSYEANFPGKSVAVVQGINPWFTQATIDSPGINPRFYSFFIGGASYAANASHVRLDYKTLAAIGPSQTGFPVNPFNKYRASFQVVDVSGY